MEVNDNKNTYLYKKDYIKIWLFFEKKSNLEGGQGAK